MNIHPGVQPGFWWWGVWGGGYGGGGETKVEAVACNEMTNWGSRGTEGSGTELEPITKNNR